MSYDGNFWFEHCSLYTQPIKDGLVVNYCRPLAVVARRGVTNAYIAKTVLLLIGSPLRDPTVLLTLFASVLYLPVVSEEVARRVSNRRGVDY